MRFLQDDVGAANVFTTRDRAVPVAVTVPDTADAQSLVPLLPAVEAALPAVEPDDAPRRPQRSPVLRRERGLHQPVHQRRVVDARTPPTSAGTSTSA